MPLDPKLQKFTTEAPFVTTVNYTDIIQNLGFIELYGATVHDGSNLLYVLTSNASMYSFEEYTKGSGGAAVILNDVEFPILIGNFFDILGDALVTIPLYITVDNTNNFVVTVTLTLTTPAGNTVLGTATATATGNGSTMDANVQMMTFTIKDIDFRLNIGDIITLKVHAEITGAGSPKGHVFHDPANRTTAGNVNSQMKVQLPVRIDR